jgi:hypothetical protein
MSCFDISCETEKTELKPSIRPVFLSVLHQFFGAFGVNGFASGTPCEVAQCLDIPECPVFMTAASYSRKHLGSGDCLCLPSFSISRCHGFHTVLFSSHTVSDAHHANSVWANAGPQRSSQYIGICVSTSVTNPTYRLSKPASLTVWQVLSP